MAIMVRIITLEVVVQDLVKILFPVLFWLIIDFRNLGFACLNDKFKSFVSPSVFRGFLRFDDVLVSVFVRSW